MKKYQFYLTSNCFLVIRFQYSFIHSYYYALSHFIKWLVWLFKYSFYHFAVWKYFFLESNDLFWIYGLAVTVWSMKWILLLPVLLNHLYTEMALENFNDLCRFLLVYFSASNVSNYLQMLSNYKVYFLHQIPFTPW